MLKTEIIVLLILTLIQVIELFFSDTKDRFAIYLPCTGNIKTRGAVLELKLPKKPWDKVHISFVALRTIVTMILENHTFFTVLIRA